MGSAGDSPKFPPYRDPGALEREYRLLPDCDRDDALQEAWVAHLEGRDPLKALKAYAADERRYRERYCQILDDQDGSAPSALDKDGRRRELAAPQKSDSSAAPVRRNSLRKAG